MKTHGLIGLLGLGLMIAACSIDVQQPPIATLAPTIQSIPTPVPPTANLPQTNIVTTTNIPVTWSDLNLTGRLVYTIVILRDNIVNMQIKVLDLVTGQLTTIFDAPQYSWIYYISVSPDAKQLLMSYAPPPGDNPVDQDIYIMPLDGAQPPKMLFTPPIKEDDYIEAEWAPDGRYIYMTHVNYQTPQEPRQVNPIYTIYRMKYPNGQLEKVVEKAFWPRVSPDSSQIVYVATDPFSYLNRLYVADADGKNAKEVVFIGPRLPDIRDAPMFSPDGKSIFFSAPLPLPSYKPSLVDKLMGIQVAKAHSGVASDWWSVAVNGGLITQLTNIQTASLFGSFSPDGQHIASHSLNGIFVMKPDGSELTMLIPNLQSAPGTVSWIP